MSVDPTEANLVDVSATFHPTEDDGYALIDNVSTTTGKKKLLKEMNLLFPEGSVSAILGPSGAGKSTLLNVLTDSLSSNSKAVADIHLPGHSSFVPQDDQLHGFFTVKSYMNHYAKMANLKLPRKELDAKIDTLLKQLGLTEQKGTRVGDIFLKGLSGGQKRRLSVALEALTDPMNLFLDEPTSGLDAESALQLMEFLKSYARAASGRRIILTIHQPSTFIWQLIDNVILLAKGKLMYEGSRKSMEEFFAKYEHPTPHGWNPADHYVTMVNDEFRDHARSVDEWAQSYQDWQKNHHLGGPKSSAFFAPPKRSGKERTTSMNAATNKGTVDTKRSNSFMAVGPLLYRYFLNLWFNPGILGTRIAMYSMLALMVGGLFWELGDRTDYESIISRSAVLFYCVAFFIFMSVAVLPFTVMERGIVDKEVLNGYYHPIAYQVAQGLSTIPAAGILAGLTSVIIVFMLKLNDGWWYFLNMFLALCTAEALAQMVSHVVPHFVIGMAGIAGLFGFFMLFMGFMVIPSDFPYGLGWTYDVAFHTYSWRSFMVTEFQNLTFDDPRSPFATGHDVLKFYEIEDVNRWNDMIVLACYAIVIHLISFMVLVIRYSYFKGKITPLNGKKQPDQDFSEAAA
ncbi:unnamed protein product [Cylindrotheca closterium]|uniref:ABC transporter domain-containing protein n=1 Tax=Cylindrotheca closterium TaxID=2856 RepID=A0AAD2G936_9STRA|nr:unnamed protein product [Cylindrotheca closterium]CAJ1965991.1 unnamed protein product [Cylindrotheca closterium]